jgi:transposase
VLLRPEQREPDDEPLIKLMAAHPALSVSGSRRREAIELAQGFASLVRQRRPDHLDGWLAQALQSSVSAFQRFAKSLQEDYEAVKAGVALTWSNGQVEGQVNRLKMLKRQMFGRAGIELLSRRFLLAG